MIEFKLAGDVMVFECPSFKVEVVADAERIAINELAASDPHAKEVITAAFEVLNMMIEHKARQTHVMKYDFDIHDARKSLREFMKKEGF